EGESTHVQIDSAELALLLEGIELKGAKRRKRYQCVFRPSRSLVPQHRDHLGRVSSRSEATFCFRVWSPCQWDGRPAWARGSRGAPGQGVFGPSGFRREGPFRVIRWAAWRTRSQMASAVVGSAR